MILVGCKPQQYMQEALPPVILNNSDSVLIETNIETTYAPVDVALDLPRQSESNITQNDSSHVETDLAFSVAWLVNGVLHHIIQNKPGQLKGNAFVPQTTKHTSKESIKVREIPVPLPYPVEIAHELTLMEQIKLAAFWYLVSGIVISAGFICRKPLLALLRKTIRL